VTGVLIARSMSEQQWQELLDQQGRPSACNGDRLCPGHYGILDPGRRARVRRTVGIREFEGRR
jgi:hypothetical protein